MSNCSNHKKDLYGESDMKKVAESIGDLHYETLAELMFELALKLSSDSINDLKGDRRILAAMLLRASNNILTGSELIKRAWIISKPFMEDKK